MRFGLNDEQQALREGAAQVLAGRDALARARRGAGHDDGLWSELCGLGWPGIIVPEELGGEGAGVLELAVLLHEHGYQCAPTPLLGSVACALAVQHAGSATQRNDWLPRLARGDVRGAVGVATDGAVAPLVADAEGAGLVVLVERDGARLLVDPAIETTAVIDAARTYARVRPGSAAEPLSADVELVRELTAIVIAAELAGLARRALDLALAHVRERQQFGRPLGAFQAVAHIAAELAQDTEVAWSSTLYAAHAVDIGLPDRALAAWSALAAAGDAGRRVTAAAIQLHGALGFTWEADVHLLYKRAHVMSRLLGTPDDAYIKIGRLAASAHVGRAT